MSESREVTIVTGSSRGVGAATARLLAKEGFDVVVNYSKSEGGAKETAAAGDGKWRGSGQANGFNFR